MKARSGRTIVPGESRLEAPADQCIIDSEAPRRVSIVNGYIDVEGAQRLRRVPRIGGDLGVESVRSAADNHAAGACGLDGTCELEQHALSVVHGHIVIWC